MQNLSPRILIFIGLATGSLALAQGKSISEFNKTDNDKLGWRIVDDGVMGGLSKGQVSFSKTNTLRFYGKLSLENHIGPSFKKLFNILYFSVVTNW